MSKHLDRRILDTNAMVMGGGVGLAALEAMFNLVQTQSILASSMVRQYDMSHATGLHAMAASMSELIDAGYGTCSGGANGNGRGVRVNIPQPQPSPGGGAGSERGAVSGVDELANMFKSRQSQASGDEGTERGAVSGIDELANLFKSHADATANVTQDPNPGIDVEHLLVLLLEVLREHLSEVLKSSKPTMLVS